MVRSSASGIDMKYQLVITMHLLDRRLRSFRLSNYLGRYCYFDFTELEMIVWELKKWNIKPDFLGPKALTILSKFAEEERKEEKKKPC